MRRNWEGNWTGRCSSRVAGRLEASKSVSAGRVWGHVRLRWGKIGGKESRLQNSKTGDDGAIWQMRCFLYLFAVIGIFGYANFGL